MQADGACQLGQLLLGQALRACSQRNTRGRFPLLRPPSASPLPAVRSVLLQEVG